MSLQMLPVELFQLISCKLKKKIDKQSLRLSCRAFYNIIDLKTLSTDIQRVSFRSRLTTPGNVFSTTDAKLCHYCAKFLPPSRFDFPKLLINNNELCNDCIFKMVFSTLADEDSFHHEYKGEEFSRCWSCETIFRSADRYMHISGVDPEDPGGQSEMIMCSPPCHKEQCHDPECNWPKDYVEQDWKHFYDWHEIGGNYCDCRVCMEIRDDHSGEKSAQLQ